MVPKKKRIDKTPVMEKCRRSWQKRQQTPTRKQYNI